MGLKGFLTTLAFGAGAMYLLDPEHGEARRNDLQNRLGGFGEEAENIWREGVADLQRRGQELRTRTENVAEEGADQVKGAAREAAGALRDATQDATGFDAGHPARFGGGANGQMAPGPRLLAIAGGSLLTLYGSTRRGLKGGALTALGLNFLSRGLVNKALPELVKKVQDSDLFDDGALERAGDKVKAFADEAVDVAQSVGFDAIKKPATDSGRPKTGR